jgi:hypothetical protein
MASVRAVAPPGRRRVVPAYVRDVITQLSVHATSELVARLLRRLQKLRSGRLLGRFFAAGRERLREVSAGLCLHRVPNLGRCPVS